ncbi:MAG: CHAT domain-containing protein [Thermoanaerobaculia bacterium]|nr:CHAT domain-containing protein [Thermoanaerobaculia bacterium]
MIDRETSLITYTLGNRRSLLFYLDRDSFEVFDLPPRAEIESLATTFHHVVKSSRDVLARPMLAPSGSRLSEILLAPVAGRLRTNVKIVRDGSLHLVPFAALPIPNANCLLIEGHRLTSIPSLSVLEYLERQPRRDLPGMIAIVAPDVPPGRLALDPRFPILSNVQAEVDTISSRAFDRQMTLLGRHATPRALFSLPFKDVGILHIAAHGLVHSDLPELSAMILTDTKGQDDYLRLIDILGEDLPIPLVVLSACESGVGEILHGEGSIGMPHAFLSAGASSVLASLWAVQDRATAEFMERFYAGLLDEQESPAEALRQAQLEFLANSSSELAAPYFWAAFELHGR